VRFFQTMFKLLVVGLVGIQTQISLMISLLDSKMIRGMGTMSSYDLCVYRGLLCENNT